MLRIVTYAVTHRSERNDDFMVGTTLAIHMGPSLGPMGDNMGDHMGRISR